MAKSSTIFCADRAPLTGSLPKVSHLRNCLKTGASFFGRAMNRSLRNLICLSILLSAIGVGPPARADEQKEADKQKELGEDPTVLAILDPNPTDPDDIVRVATILDDLGRPDLGKKYLRKLLESSLSDKQLVNLLDQFGSPTFSKMVSRPGLRPEAKQLADAVFDAAGRRFGNPKRLAILINQLQDPSERKRFEASSGLILAGRSAVMPLISVLADPARKKEHANVRATLVRLGAAARDPVLGTLNSKDPKLVAQMIRVIKQSGDRKSALYLLEPLTAIKSDPQVRAEAQIALKELVGHVPAAPEVINLLVSTTEKHLNAKQTIRTDEFDRGSVWTWDETKKAPVVKRLPEDHARLMLAARFAKQAYAIAPGNDHVQKLYLTSKLELAAHTKGPEHSLGDVEATAGDEVASFGTKAVEDVLEYAMSTQHIKAAIAAAKILGRIGTPEELLYNRATPGPLVKAAQAGDRRLRLTAIDAIVKLAPDRTFAGCSTIPKMLAFFASLTGSRQVLIAGVGGKNEQALVGYLGELGYTTNSVATGRELVRQAISSPDYEFALVYTSIGPNLSIALQQLRHDCRSATLSVGILASSGRLEWAKRIAKRDPLAEAFPRPHSKETCQWQIKRLIELADRNFVPHPERNQQAIQAVELLSRLSEGPQEVFNIGSVQTTVLPGVYVPKIGLTTISILKNLGTPASQSTLLDLASRTLQPLEVRRAASEAFDASVKKYGILLTTEKIKRQYERYNHSKYNDKATQEVFGALLDSIEADLKTNDTAGSGDDSTNRAGEK